MATLPVEHSVRLERRTVATSRTMAGVWLLLGVAAVTFVGALVRGEFLDHPVRYDEALNYLWFSSRSPGYVLTHYNPNNHVLHTFMERCSITLFGAEPFALRLPTFIGGVLLIPLAAWMSWTVFRSRWGALMTATAVAACSQLIEYSANARGYLWLSVFTTAAVIVTHHAIASPRRLRTWMLWGVVGALGAYTMPLMVYPFAGLVVAAMLALVRKTEPADRRAIVRGVVIGSALCGLLTIGLYAPILLTQGVAATWETRQMTYAVWGPRVGSFGSMLAGTWAEWVRDTTVVWRWGLIVGVIVFTVRTVRHPTRPRVLPLVMLAVALLVVGLQGAPLRSRAWMFALPVFLACSVEGLRGLLPGGLPGRPRTALASIGSCVLVLAALTSLDTVRRHTYLCSEPHVLVDIESILDECSKLGPEHCAVIMRYTPADFYYRSLKDIPASPAPSSPAAQHVLIAADGVRSLAEQWNPSIDGYAAFHPPVMHKQLDRCTLYRADCIAGLSPSGAVAALPALGSSPEQD